MIGAVIGFILFYALCLGIVILIACLIQWYLGH